MKKRILKIIPFLIFCFSMFPAEGDAHSTSLSLWYFSSFPYYHYSPVSYSSYRRPAVFINPTAVSQSLKTVETLRTLGELKKENWLAAKKNPPQFIPAPVPPEPSLEAPQIKTKTKKE